MSKEMICSLGECVCREACEVLGRCFTEHECFNPNVLANPTIANILKTFRRHPASIKYERPGKKKLVGLGNQVKPKKRVRYIAEKKKELMTEFRKHQIIKSQKTIEDFLNEPEQNFHSGN